MKKYSWVILFAAFFFTACFKDKGNYDYTELADIKIEGIPPAIEVLGYLDRIIVSPTITSSAGGEIAPDDPNYTFRYRMGTINVHGNFANERDISPGTGYSLDTLAAFNPGSYKCLFTVTDNRNNTVTSLMFDIRVTSTTYEGWLVLCDEGPEERVRLDMISLISSTRISPIYDIAAGLPPLHHATQIMFHPMRSTGGDVISLFSKEGAYRLNNATLETDPTLEFNISGFLHPPAEKMTAVYSFSITGDPNHRTRHSFVISDAGNVYRQGHGEAGSIYGLPINTSVGGTDPEYKVAPFVGCTQVRPSNSTAALLYDRDNKQFVGFTDNLPNQLSPIQDPDPKLFSFQTGKNMVYMEGTRRSNGLVYAILQNEAGERSIYAINMGGNGFTQEAYYDNITAPGFREATLFAFHSQFPLMFYATGNKVYLYNLGTQTAKEMTNIPQGEITCLKFNLFRNPLLTNLNKQTPEFMNQQFQLIIGSYNNQGTGVNGGKVGFYEVDGLNNSISKVVEYDGFAKVKDVVYRER